MADYYYWNHGMPPLGRPWRDYKILVNVNRYRPGPTPSNPGTHETVATYVLANCHSREEVEAKARGFFHLYCTTHGIPVERTQHGNS